MNKKTLTNIIIGWQMIEEYNKSHDLKISMDQFVKTYMSVAKINEPSCVNCIKCEKCK